MKAILISDHAKWCALMMNGIKKIEVRKGTALYKATQKLIDEYGYAEFYVYCTKGKPNLWMPYEYDCFELDEASQPYLSDKPIVYIDIKMNGKVLFKFRCYKVERIMFMNGVFIDETRLLKQSCLNKDELFWYLAPQNSIVRESGYALHIDDLEIFDRPKELSEFYPYCKDEKCEYRKNHCSICHRVPLTKAPQSWCYVEVEE